MGVKQSDETDVLCQVMEIATGAIGGIVPRL